MDTTRLLIIAQLISKTINVFLNAVLLRRIGPTIFAISARLDFIPIMILSLSRESQRMALIKFGPPNEKARQGGRGGGEWRMTLFAAAWKTMLIGWGVSGVVAGITAYFRDVEMLSTAELKAYSRSNTLFVIAAMIELAYEPAFLWLMHNGRMDIRVAVETSAIIVKSVILGRSVSHLEAIEHLGTAQTISAIVMLVLYYASYIIHTRDISALMVKPSDKHRLLSNAYKNSGLRFFMAQSDSLCMMLGGRSKDLRLFGLYAIVGNYAGLILRLVQSPLEEAGFLLYSDCFAASVHTEDGTQVTRHAQQATGYKFIAKVLRFDQWLAVGCLCFGLQYSRLIACFLFPLESVEDGTRLLRWFCILIPVMAVSGALESFMNGTVLALGSRRLVWVNAGHALLCFSLNLMHGNDPIGMMRIGIISFAVRALIGGVYLAFMPGYGKTSAKWFIGRASVLRCLSLTLMSRLVGLYAGDDGKAYMTAGIASIGLILADIYQTDREAIPL